MELPYGVSGFYNSDEEKPPAVEGSRYKELCYELATNLDGELLEFADSLYPSNFYKADFKFPALNICLVMNKHYPILSFATAVEDLKIQFIDYPAGTEAIPKDFTVLSAEFLEMPVPEKLDEFPDNKLNKGEFKQINYWKPEIIGQIVFNFWD